MTTNKETLASYYSLLRLAPDADLDQLKKCYKARVKAWHPDKLPSSSKKLQDMATEKLNLVNKAYEVLEKHIKAGGKNPKGTKVPKRGEESKSSSSDSSQEQNKTKKQTPPNPESSTGEVFHTLSNGDKYAGDIEDKKPHGEGVYIFSGGNRYIGEFKNGKPHGVGEFTFSTGDKYIGQFKEDSMEGQGTYHYTNGDKYSGEFKAGQPHGDGTYTASSGKLVRGVWKKGSLISELE
jgi:hypothetical protein